MKPSEAAEKEVLEYLLGLDGLGLGGKGERIYAHWAGHMERPLLHQLKRAVKLDDSVEMARVDGELTVAWRQLLEQLRNLWLTEGRARVDLEAS